MGSGLRAVDRGGKMVIVKQRPKAVSNPLIRQGHAPSNVARLPPLERLRTLAEAQKETTEKINEAIGFARRKGASWPEIGAALGVTDRAASMRFKAHQDKARGANV